MIAERNLHLGSSFDDFFIKQGIREETVKVASKRVQAFQLRRLRKASALGRIRRLPA